MQGFVAGDPQLVAHEDHLRYRYAQYGATREAIEAAEGSLAAFAKVRGSRA